jgi:hypothetical protein
VTRSAEPSSTRSPVTSASTTGGSANWAGRAAAFAAPRDQATCSRTAARSAGIGACRFTWIAQNW